MPSGPGKKPGAWLRPGGPRSHDERRYMTKQKDEHEEIVADLTIRIVEVPGQPKRVLDVQTSEPGRAGTAPATGPPAGVRGTRWGRLMELATTRRSLAQMLEVHLVDAHDVMIYHGVVLRGLEETADGKLAARATVSIDPLHLDLLGWSEDDARGHLEDYMARCRPPLAPDGRELVLETRLRVRRRRFTLAVLPETEGRYWWHKW